MSVLDQLPPDYRDMLLAAEQVDYLLVGGWAVAVHGHQRMTKDLDIFEQLEREPARVTGARPAPKQK